MTDYDEEIDAEMTQQIGGSDNDKSFIDYMTSLSPTEKGQIMNLVQYCGIAVIPLLAVLKMMKIYMPVNNPLKPTSELVFEVLVQLIVILIAFFFIHKLILYFPTYSQVNYEQFSLLSSMLPLLFLMFTLDTKISEKLNVLFDRLLGMLGLMKEPYQDEEEEKKEKKETTNKREPIQIHEPVHSTMREPIQTTSIEELSGIHTNSGFGNFEPLPSNY
uniref:Uncharacterized protein n=1 Tax=viral metagenome TaxID=1070528 RepID=A0A6C0KWI7_9ZZZZ|tara:strand:+ start:20564 stop:21214 length:651 start_codon:yes stop_codon:yes gene_type:complete